MSDAPPAPWRRPLRLAIALIVALHLSIAAIGLLRGPPATDELSAVWPGYLAMCAAASLRILLTVWMVFGGGSWLLRWPVAIIAASLLVIAASWPYQPPGAGFSVYIEPLLGSLLPMLGVGLMGAVAVGYGWRATLSPEPAPVWRTSLRETLATMLLLALWLVAIRSHSTNEQALTTWALNAAAPLQPQAGSTLLSELLTYIVEPSVSVLWMAVLVVATVVGRPRLAWLATALIASYAIGVAAALIVEVKLGGLGASVDMTLHSGVCSAVAGAFVLASLLTLRLLHWRLERRTTEPASSALSTPVVDEPAP